MSKLRVFISYTHSDSWFVDDLAADLKGCGIDVWIDKWQIGIGESIIERINKGIDESDFLIVVLSRNSINSKWVKEELNAATFMNIQDEKRFRILPVLLEDCTVPPLLRHRKYANFKDSPQIAFKNLVDSISVGLSEELRGKCEKAYLAGFKLSHAALILPMEKATEQEFLDAIEDIENIIEAYNFLISKPNKKNLKMLKNIHNDLMKRKNFSPERVGRNTLLQMQQMLFDLPNEIATNQLGQLFDFFLLGHTLGHIAISVLLEPRELDMYANLLKQYLSKTNYGLPLSLESYLKRLSNKDKELLDYEDIQDHTNKILFYIRGY